MKSSLITRLTRTLFFSIVVSISISLLIVELFVEDVEDKILHLEMKSEADFFIDQIKNGDFKEIKTARLHVFFLAKDEDESLLPFYLKNHSFPLSKEIKIEEETFLIYGVQLNQPAGKLFLSQNITIMEDRELLVQLILLSIAGFMLVCGYFGSRFIAKYLDKPFSQLTTDILRMTPNSSSLRIETQYKDQEFCEIAQVFNRFLTEFEQYIDREKLFVKLASHELRTPLAVMRGALNVLEQRQTLSAADAKTLKRIHRAWQTMRDDTEVLLELARAQGQLSKGDMIDLEEEVIRVIDDLIQEQPEHTGRIQLSRISQKARIQSHAVLVRMLMRNLLQNALRHTRSSVQVRITDTQLIVRDFGTGLPLAIIKKIKKNNNLTRHESSFQNGSATFGLLLVRLVCERLEWDLDVIESHPGGTEFCIRYK